jgi:DNA helicase HerA-like ATPase
MVGRCLKSKFFAFAFERENKVRPFFYVVDEAHRFLSAGAEDGEQSLLDRCRAYRTGVVLATQSVAAIAYRLEQCPGGKNAMDMLLNNCGNAMYFRTPDSIAAAEATSFTPNVRSTLPLPLRHGSSACTR